MSLRFWITHLVLVLGFCAPRPAAPQNSIPPARLDINLATAEELAQLRGIGPTRAEALVRMRQQNGPFRSVEELRALPRLPESVFQQLRERVAVTTFSGEESASQRTAHRRKSRRN